MSKEERQTPAYRTRLHWVMLFGPAVLMIVAGLSIPARGPTAVVFLVLGVVWGIFSSVSLERSEFILTRSRFLVKTGFPWRRSYDLPFTEIEGIDVYQPTLGKILNFGKVTIKTIGRRRTSFRMVRDPLRLAHLILENKHGRQGKSEEGE